MNKPIILASASPRRFELMRQIGIKPQIIASEVDEDWDGEVDGIELAQKLAIRKVKASANKIMEGIIISADTVVALEGRIFGKPGDFEDAFHMLCSLRGRTHSVITGIAVLEQPEGKFLADYEETRVCFKELSDEEIKAYINWGESWDKAGGYGIQGRGALLVEKIEGDYFNVVGLPLQKLNKLLLNFQINLLLEKSETGLWGEN